MKIIKVKNVNSEQCSGEICKHRSFLFNLFSVYLLRKYDVISNTWRSFIGFRWVTNTFQLRSAILAKWKYTRSNRSCDNLRPSNSIYCACRNRLLSINNGKHHLQINRAVSTPAHPEIFLFNLYRKVTKKFLGRWSSVKNPVIWVRADAKSNTVKPLWCNNLYVIHASLVQKRK